MQNSYLREMGIDVWVLRGSQQPEVMPLATSGVLEHRFHLCFLNYHSLGICLALDDEEDVISTATRRFCDDVALAFTGESRQPGANNLKWPVRGSEDNSFAAAQSVISQRLMGLPGLVLVFGKEATACIRGMESAGDDEVLILDGRQIIALDSISDICSGVTGKRTLWQRLQRVKDTKSVKGNPG